jgi:hypothetical protein
MRVYPAAPSRGSLWILGGTLVILAMVAGSWALGLRWMSLVFLPFALFSILLAIWLPGMTYELGERALVARCGPFSFTVPYRAIMEVSRQDLVLNPISCVRGPGYALFWVPYADQGVVMMCATRAVKDILLISTARRKYGFTPGDIDGFLEELGRRLEEP